MMCSFFFFRLQGIIYFHYEVEARNCLVNAIREKSTFAESLSEFSRSIPALKMGIG